jgi:hypothetical protein
VGSFDGNLWGLSLAVDSYPAPLVVAQAILDDEGPELPAIGSVIGAIRATLSSQQPQPSGA